MKILFLGTSAGWPLPRLGCSCQICKSQDSKDKRLRPGILVNDKILLDAPFDIYHQLQKENVNTKEISHILLTHAHDDHIWGLYDLSHIYGRENPIIIISTKSVLSGIKSRLKVTLSSFRLYEANPFEKVNLFPDTFCWFIPVKHTIDTFAIKIKAPKPIVYAPEFRKIEKSAQKFLGDIDLAIIDGSSKERFGQAKGHETITEGLKLGKRLNAKRILFTNIGHKTDTHKNLERFVTSQGNHKFSVAFDGMIIKL